MTNDLIAFLRARLDEDEQAARDAAVWWGDSDEPGEALHWRRVPCGHIWHNHDSSIADEVMPPHADHIARHDPARVLLEVEAKRRLVAEIFEYEATEDGELGCCHSADDIAAGQCPGTDLDKLPALRLLALPYADHPDYREQWRP